MSHHAESAGRIGGNTILFASALGEWLSLHGLSSAMVWIALCGLLLNLATSLPALERSFQTVRGWFKK